MLPTRYSNWSLVRRLLALTWHYRSGCAQLIVLQLAVLGLGLAGLTLTGQAVDTIAQHVIANAEPPHWPWGLAPPAGWAPMRIVVALALGVLVVGLVRSVLNYSYAVVAARLLQQQIVVDLRARVFEKLQWLGFRYFSDSTTGSLINRVTSDVQSVRLFIDGVILQLLVLVTSLAVCGVYMVSINVNLTLLCLATTPVLWTLSTTFARQVRPAHDRNRDLVDQMLLVLAENVRGVQVVQGFGRQPEEIAKFRAANRAVRDQQRWITWRVSLFSPTAEMLMTINMAALLGYGGWLVIQDRLALGSGLIVFSGLLQQLSTQVTKVTNLINNVLQSLAGAQRVFAVLDAPQEIHSKPGARRLSRAKGAIRFHDVGFHYLTDRPVLQGIDFEVEPGQRVAILGTTGAGKTTLLNLLPRFYDPTAGRVFIDGVDLREFEVESLRRNVGMVFQDNFLFSDTIAANIAFGRPDASLAQIEQAARIAAAHRFISALPDGYDTVLREAAKDLSGGQRQRLAIARAVLLEPAILLLDDPTAAIDASTEQEILEAMERAMAGRTTFVVAHRLSTLMHADLVLVLEQGRIVERGTHDELMRRRGMYWRTARLQTDERYEESLAATGGFHLRAA